MTLSDIKQALEGGETGRELDAAIARAVGWTDVEEYVPGHGHMNWCKDTTGATRFKIPHHTTSVDAALALVWNVFPTTGLMLKTVKRSDDTLMGWSVSMSANYRTPYIEATHKSPASALLLALITAKEQSDAVA